MHATSPIMTLGMLCAALPLVLAADTFSNAGLLCKAPCHMDGLTGACHTNFCGTRLFAPGKTVACCKLGVKQSPCDGTVGCHQDNCCTALTYTQSPALPPPPPPPRPPPHYATAEDATLMAGAGACNFASLRFKLGKIVEDDHRDDVKGGASVAWSAASTRAASDSLCQRAYTHVRALPAQSSLRHPPVASSDYASSAAQVWVTPWQAELRVVLLIRPHGEYIKVTPPLPMPCG